MKYHLAILTPGWIDLILDGMKDHREPFHESPEHIVCDPSAKSTILDGDSVYLKESGGVAVLSKGSLLPLKWKLFIFGDYTIFGVFFTSIGARFLRGITQRKSPVTACHISGWYLNTPRLSILPM